MADIHVTPPAKRLPAVDLRGILQTHIQQGIRDFNDGVLHSFGESTDYDLIHEGKRYPPKAILGLAGKYALGRVLNPDDFSGGEDSTCFRILRDHGFEVGPKESLRLHFEVGRLYSRSEDIHKPFGGQMRGGICTPRSVPAVFLFTGKSGDQFGYLDKWADDHSHYSFAGEGQEGNMGMKGGNRAIRDHVADGRALHLFEALGKGQPIRYMGTFNYLCHRVVPGKDKHGATRNILIFDLVPQGEFKPTADPILLDKMTRMLVSKKWTSPPEGQEHPEMVPQVGSPVYKRDPEVRAFALNRAKGVCALCEDLAPFKDAYGAWFLEIHHVIHLAIGGPDTIDNCVALCPNCHRKMHYSSDTKKLIAQLFNKYDYLNRHLNNID